MLLGFTDNLLGLARMLGVSLILKNPQLVVDIHTCLVDFLNFYFHICSADFLFSVTFPENERDPQKTRRTCKKSKRNS